VYKEFRCGLVHEARIKNGGQFTYQIKKVIMINKGIILINPEKLLEELKDKFNNYIDSVLKDPLATKELNDKIIRDFELDVKFVNDKFRCKNCGGTGIDPLVEDSIEKECNYCRGTGRDTERNFDRELERAQDAVYFSDDDDLNG
jgi:hypothetical protein